MATLTVTLINPSTGQPISGLTNVRLYLGSSALQYNGDSPAGTDLGVMTEEGTSGSYTATINKTNAYTIRVSGVANDEYTNVWVPSADIVGTYRLAEDGAGSGGLPSGASLIGVNDPDGRYTGTNVQTILNEISGARGSVANANIKWLYDKVDGWNVTDAEINALNTAACTLADFQKLHALTATSAEINKLAGASANVTAANLNTLTGGGATTLHTHSSFTAVTSIRGQQSGNHCLDFTIDLSAFVSSGDGGDLLITTAPLGTGAWGQVKIYTVDGYFRVVTEWDTGDFDYSGTNFLSGIDPADIGPLDRAIRELDSRIGTLWQMQFPGVSTIWKPLWANATKAATGAVTPGSSPTLASWTQTSASETTIVRVWLNPTDEGMWTLRLKAYAKVASGGTVYVKLRHVTSSTEVDATITSTTDAWVTTGELTLPASYATPQEFQVILKGDATHLATVYENLIIEGK